MNSTAASCSGDLPILSNNGFQRGSSSRTRGLNQHLAHGAVIIDAKHKKVIKLKNGTTAAIQQINCNGQKENLVC